MSLIINCFKKMTKEWNKNELKGYKVTNVDRTRKFGVACRSLQELKRKACAKFNISTEEENAVKIYLIDGSEIDEEYFPTVQPQTTLILLKKGETLLSDADILYNTLREVNLDFIKTGDKISKFLSENLKSKVSILNRALNKDDSKTCLSSREEHPDWFKHLETTANTKEAYMHRRCQDRIRCYLYKTIEQLKNSEIYTKNGRARENLTNAMLYFKLQLREDHYFGFYFDRSYAGSNVKDNRRDDVLCRNSKTEEEDEGEGEDESDNLMDRCYDHCPCRMKVDRCDNGDTFVSEFSASKNEGGTSATGGNEREGSGDELDGGKRVKSAKARSKKLREFDVKSRDDAAAGDFPYEIKIGETGSRLAICDYKGEFRCHGIWKSDRCAYGKRHSINPYRSYEELILFSTWNFDHGIERSRTLIPSLLKASENDELSNKEITYFYDNIFTTKNLRLVHVICHDKGTHKQ